MRLMSCLRLTVALFICPALRVHNGPGAAKALDLPGDRLRFGAKDAPEKAAAKIPAGAGFFSPEAARQSRSDRRAIESPEKGIAVSDDGIAVSLAGVNADVTVQPVPGGPWFPGRLINGALHWIAPKVEAADLEAICAIYERANQKVPDAIAALRSRGDPPVAGEETRPSSQTLPDGAPNADAANSCFRLLQSAPKGGL